MNSVVSIWVVWGGDWGQDNERLVGGSLGPQEIHSSKICGRGKGVMVMMTTTIMLMIMIIMGTLNAKKN